jgi:hypothetical protein
MHDFNVVEGIYNDYHPSEEQSIRDLLNVGIIVDNNYHDSSKKNRDLFCVFIVLRIVEGLFIEPLTSERYTYIFDNYSDDIPLFIDVIISRFVIKREYQVYLRDIRIMLDWYLNRRPDTIYPYLHNNGWIFVEIFRPIGGSKRRPRDKTSRVSKKNKKRKINYRTKKRRIIK